MRRPHAQAGHARQRVGCQPVHADREDAHRRRPRVAEAQVQGAKAVALAGLRLAQRAAQPAAALHMAADAVGVAKQAGGASHIACGQRFTYRGARDALAVHFVALHARHVETGRIARGIEHRVVAGAAGAEAKVVADQHIACAQATQQHVVDESLRRSAPRSVRRSAARRPARCRSVRARPACRAGWRCAPARRLHARPWRRRNHAGAARRSPRRTARRGAALR